jgi:divalent metal cation (Fe/Co/Zn/Cd) transporter
MPQGMQTQVDDVIIACAWLSITTLAGLLLNAVRGWWWADPAAALAIVPLVIREGMEGWRGKDAKSN